MKKNTKISARKVYQKEKKNFIKRSKKVFSNKDEASIHLLAAGIAHEFHNLLGAADGHAQWALESGELADLKEALEVVRLVCQRSSQITRALQNFSQPREDSKEIVSLNSLFEEISKIYTKLCTEKNIKLSIKVPTQMASIWANKMDIEEVLINLIKNAIEALDENQNPAKTLNVWCEKKSKLYLLNVSDNGPGIPDLYSELIFRPFWTTKGVLKNIQSTAPAQNASNNAKNQQGSGLGLYLSRMRCLEQGGKLILKKKKLGAHFVIEIPAYS